jgi:hypothetical protein
MWLWRRMEKDSHVPAGMWTVPPPEAWAAVMAALMAGVSRVMPSPMAPKARMSKEGVGTVGGVRADIKLGQCPRWGIEHKYKAQKQRKVLWFRS